MLFWTVVRTALRGIVAHKLRSFLAILGVIIGVASVISMLALGAGTRTRVTQSMRNFGANLLSVRPEWRRSTTGVRAAEPQSLKVADAQAILAQVPEIDMVTPDLDASFVVKYLNKNTRVEVNGEAVTYFEMRSFPIASGRTFNEAEVNRHARVAVLGPKTVEALFESADPVGETIKIKGANYVVVGVTKPKDENSDDNIWVPYTTAMSQLMGRDSIEQIYCRVRDGIDPASVIPKVTEVMRRQHRVQPDMPDTVTVRNNQEVADTLEDVSNMFTSLLAGVAAISLLVGGVNIMNIMLVTVSERTREIGIRKALGARQTDLLSQFLIESSTISMTGGLIGVLLGLLSIVLFNYFTELFTGTAYGAEIQLWPIVVAFGFSSLVGIFFGWYPARRAARLNPIEALRYE